MTTAITSANKAPKWIKSAINYWWLVGVGIVVTYWVASTLRSLLIQIIIALFLALAMHPLVERLCKQGMKRGIATGISMVIVFTFFGIFSGVMGALVVNQIQDLSDELPGYATSISEWAESTFDFEIDADQVNNEITDRVGGSINTIASSALNVSGTVVGLLFQILTVSLFAFYFSADGPKLRRTMCSMFPEEKQVEVIRIWELAIDKTGAFISSRVILAIASAIFHSLVFWIIGVPSPIALGIWVGIVSQFVPVIGTYISGILPALIALANEPISALWVIAVILGYQQIENYVLQPRITAQTLNMHPAIAFGGVLAGSSLLGATGAVLALPFIATAQAVLDTYVDRHNVIDSDLVDRRNSERQEPEDPTAVEKEAETE